MDEALPIHPEQPLPDDVPTLQRLVRELLGEVERLRQENARLQQRLDQALQERFGRRSERQRRRVPPPTSPPEQGHAVLRHGRRRLPEHLERREVVHDLTESERLCPCCGAARASIGVQTSEQLDYDPACLFVRRHVRKVYACPRCAGGAAITTAGPATVGPLPKGLAGPGLLAHLIVSKYDDHLPLNRLEDILQRNGLRVPRSTQCDWLARCAALLRPLVELMHGRILQSRVIHSDDTPVAYQLPGAAGTKEGHLWVYLGDRDHPYIVYDFTAGYSRDGPERMLAGYTGYLQADALAQYEGLYASGRVLHSACWAHARRKFVEAEREDPARVGQALAKIGALYAVERDMREQFTPEDDAGRQGYRSARAEVILEDLHSWLVEQQAAVLPGGLLGKAINYALRHWAALRRYVEEGYLAIDNNAAERALRPVAVGRKNWLWCGSVQGGQTAAILYSVVQSCGRLGVEPESYLREALLGLGELGGKATEEERSVWLPDAWQARRATAIPSASGPVPVAE